jgi:site-specific DNA-methyltransferase (adenine-specific)
MTAQYGDALDLLRSLADGCAALVVFDPQHRSVLDYLKFGNEAARQRGRAGLPAMANDYITDVCLESARVLKPGAYLMRWVDTFCLCEGHHLGIAFAKSRST